VLRRPSRLAAMPDTDAPESGLRAAVEQERAARETRLRDPMGWWP
jgi:hypothetical protein